MTHAHSYFEPPLRSNGVLIECQEHPSPLLSVKDAADRAGVAKGTFVTALKRHAWNSGPRAWAPIGPRNLHFRRVPREEIPEPGDTIPRKPYRTSWKPRSDASLAPAAIATPIEQNRLGEARPRFRGDSIAINAHLVGGAARITHADNG